MEKETIKLEERIKKGDIFYSSFGENDQITVKWYKIFNILSEKEIQLIELESLQISEFFCIPDHEKMNEIPFNVMVNNLIIKINEKEKLYMSTKWDFVKKIRNKF